MLALRLTVVLILAVVIAAFKKPANFGNKIAAAALTFGLMIQPVVANDQLSSPQFVVEKEGKKAKFHMGGGMYDRLEKEGKKAKVCHSPFPH